MDAKALRFSNTHAQGKVDGLHIQHGTLKDLDKLTPCSACLAEKMRKLNHPPTKSFTDVSNLTTATSNINAPLSWTPSTENKLVNHNETVSFDWGIINKKAKANEKNVFALFLDTNTGNVFVYAAENEQRSSWTCIGSLHTTIRQAPGNCSR